LPCNTMIDAGLLKGQDSMIWNPAVRVEAEMTAKFSHNRMLCDRGWIWKFAHPFRSHPAIFARLQGHSQLGETMKSNTALAVLISGALLAMTESANAELKVGDNVPDFEMVGSDGKT
jgi:hypothetical protein